MSPRQLRWEFATILTSCVSFSLGNTNDIDTIRIRSYLSAPKNISVSLTSDCWLRGGSNIELIIQKLVFICVLIVALCMSCGCQSLRKNCCSPDQIPPEYLAERRTDKVPLDLRLLGAPVPEEHTVGKGDVLGIYIADIMGNRDELPSVDYPGFRLRNAPVEPFVGQPVKVDSDGTMALPYIKPIHVAGMTIPQVRNLIRNQYVEHAKLIQPGRDNIQVNLITPSFVRINVLRQDTRYNLPGLQTPSQFEISRRWSGTTLYLEPKEASVLTAINRTGGLPGIDAMNEIWVMKRVSPGEVDELVDPFVSKLTGEFPMMLPKENSKLVRIPLTHPVGQPLPFERDDVILGDDDIVFLPRRDGDVFMTGGLLPGGRFPLARDRDTDIFEAIAIATGSSHGIVAGSKTPNFQNGPGGIIAPTEVIIIRHLNENKQVKIMVDLKTAANDPAHRVKIMRGDLIIMRYKPHELFGNVALNLFNFNVVTDRGFIF